ncbi:beta-ketoacyl synthase N-terminal-like domain-containing protein, partial [Klebsiella pneumoniae]|uniref:beta-ketoacyl synthase N-terminal-like domain-containing protein n=1 Tax=Klebsiella pneumoniae TaxID=573 RepID=UPI003B97D5A0
MDAAMDVDPSVTYGGSPAPRLRLGVWGGLGRNSRFEGPLSALRIASLLSVAFNAVGPAVTVDTACSTAATALHLGCQSLRLGECDVA